MLYEKGLSWGHPGVDSKQCLIALASNNSPFTQHPKRTCNDEIS